MARLSVIFTVVVGSLVVLTISSGLVQGAPQNAAGGAAPAGSLNLLRPDAKLTTLTDQELMDFLENESAVEEFTECFLANGRCASKGASNLIREIKKLGLGGDCKGCTMEEQKRVHMIIFNFIKSFMTQYRSHWRRVLPNLKFLLA